MVDQAGAKKAGIGYQHGAAYMREVRLHVLGKLSGCTQFGNKVGRGAEAEGGKLIHFRLLAALLGYFSLRLNGIELRCGVLAGRGICLDGRGSLVDSSVQLMPLYKVACDEIDAGGGHFSLAAERHG